MKKITLENRVKLYTEKFTKWSAPQILNDRIYDMWIIGNDYKGSGYHGSYPPGYLRRITTMFPDMEKVVHLFSGSLPPGDYIRIA